METKTKSVRKSKYPTKAWVKCIISKGVDSDEVIARDLTGNDFHIFIAKKLLKDNQEYNPKSGENRPDWFQATIAGYNSNQKKYIGVLPQPNILGNTTVLLDKELVDFDFLPEKIEAEEGR